MEDQHHESCPFCDITFIGATDADMVEHIEDEHGKVEAEIEDVLGLPRLYRRVCIDCGREYVTNQGDCPYCR